MSACTNFNYACKSQTLLTKYQYKHLINDCTIREYISVTIRITKSNLIMNANT